MKWIKDNLHLIIFFGFIFLLASFCGGCKKRMPNPGFEFQGDALEELKQCKPKEVDPDTFECPKEGIVKAGKIYIHCVYDLKQCMADSEACGKYRAREAWDCEQKLDAWHRQWYITIPMGIASGVIITVIAL